MTEERAQRRLAAILAADVAGYSRLMGPTRRARLPVEGASAFLVEPRSTNTVDREDHQRWRAGGVRERGGCAARAAEFSAA